QSPIPDSHHQHTHSFPTRRSSDLNKETQKVLEKTSSGGVCINNTLLHIANHHLPFGGVGNSGMGKYHGKESFIAFSNQRAVLQSPTWIDLPFQYPPFKYFKWIKKII